MIEEKEKLERRGEGIKTGILSYISGEERWTTPRVFEKRQEEKMMENVM